MRLGQTGIRIYNKQTEASSSLRILMCVVHLLCYYLLSVPLLSLSAWCRLSGRNQAIVIPTLVNSRYVGNMILLKTWFSPTKNFPTCPSFSMTCVCVCVCMCLCVHLSFPNQIFPQPVPYFSMTCVSVYVCASVCEWINIFKCFSTDKVAFGPEHKCCDRYKCLQREREKERERGRKRVRGGEREREGRRERKNAR